MTPEQFLEAVRPHFGEMLGKLSLEPEPEPGSNCLELRFEHEAYDLCGVVVVEPDDLADAERRKNKLLEAQANAETLREALLHGYAPFRAGYPKPNMWTELAE